MTTKQSKAQPITAHRLFPAIVALWFAALFGIGSFVVPVEMLESLVTATGLPRLVPAAAPPLGFTARAMVALALTGLGALAGVLVALRLRPRPAADAAIRGFGRAGRAAEAGEGRRRARDLHPDAPVRRPVAVREDLSDIEPLGEPAFETTTGPVRKRALRAAQDEQPVSPLREHAPLPWGEELEQQAEADAGPPPFAAPLVATALLDVQPSWPEEEVTPDARQPEMGDPETDDIDEAEFVPMTETGQVAEAEPARTPAFGPVAESVDEPAPAPSAPAPFAATLAAAATAAPVAERPIDELGTVQLVERLAMAMASRRERIAARAVPIVSDSRPAFAVPSMQAEPEADFGPAIELVDDIEAEAEHGPASADAFEPYDTVAETDSFVAAADFDAEAQPEPDAITIAENPDSMEVAPATPEALDAPQDDRPFDRPAAEAPAQVVSLRPAALEPAATDFTDDDDEAEQPAHLQRFLGGARPAAPAQVASAPSGFDEAALEQSGHHAAIASDDAGDLDDADDEDGGEEDDRYPSLLEMSRHPGKPEFVRIEEPAAEAIGEIEPVVVFPGQGARGTAPFAPPPAAVPGGAQAFEAPQAARPVPAGNSEETDRALRAALATLQRMTNAR